MFYYKNWKKIWSFKTKNFFLTFDKLFNCIIYNFIIIIDDDNDNDDNDYYDGDGNDVYLIEQLGVEADEVD